MAENMELLSENILIKSYDDIKGVFSGTLVRYGNRDKQGDIVLNNGCDKSALEWKNGRMIPALYEHKPDIIISKNMLSVYAYNNGLEIELHTSNDFKNNYPAEFKTMVDAYHTGTAYFSVGINAAKSTYQKIDASDKNGVYTRYIFSDVYVVEGSFTTNPANPQAKVDYMKSHRNNLEIIKDIQNVHGAQEFLRKCYSEQELSKSDIMALLDKVQEIGIQKNLSFAGSQGDVAGHQNSLTLLLSEVAKQLKQK